MYEIAINKIKLFNLVSLALADTRIVTTIFIVFKHFLFVAKILLLFSQQATANSQQVTVLTFLSTF
ncbi:MAG: hypothetical protein O4859_06885 [Trichodesmium sp. St18_bin1]|nr:hypothetical protein [Trichodesmium sp. St18_bin1]MDE5119059.1 hypothetical protein [Trichodesmium sp. St19_bin1]